MKKLIKYILIATLFNGGLLFMGCSSSPSAEELKQLDELKKEVSSLEKKIADSKGEKASLEKQVAEKNGRLQQCQSDQEVVKKGLGK